MAANRIVLIESGKNQYDELVAAGAIKPGHLVEQGSAGTIVVHGTAGGKCKTLIATEDSLQGKTITQAYASGDVVRVHKGLSGDHVYLRVPASAPAIVIGDNLVGDGTGCVIKIVTSTHHIFGEALEAVDNSAGGSEAFIKVRLI